MHVLKYVCGFVVQIAYMAAQILLVGSVIKVLYVLYRIWGDSLNRGVL